jgi:NAD(P)-dependent dehydrogenase (short-subunit alcohol dehydrogenase family)
VVGIDGLEHEVGTLSLRADLTVETEVERAFARIHHERGRIDVLVNNAGLTISRIARCSTWPRTPGTACSLRT